MTDSSHENWKPASNPWAVAIVVTLAVFMEILDTTIVNVALPHVAGSLSASYDESTWVLTSYLVANGIVLPISAFLSRLFGRKQFFLICIVMFTICSFLCGIATELWQITWVLTSYLVANGIVLPISAFLSRLFGRKQFFLICIVMFTICS
ncbi:MFS transporter, partial [Enterobacter hormaechei subsp. hoffmannii]|nr:MFS transporter [Enterobacter hormaechei subsp. hoffmannii]